MRSALLCLSLAAGIAHAAEPHDQVVKAIQESVQDSTRLTACLLLQQANTKAGQIDSKTRKKAVELVSQRLKNADATMLRARADVARKGLYGYAQDEGLAFQLYSRARKSPEAGWNGALMLYQRSAGGLTPSNAKQIIDLLKASGASQLTSRGIVGSQAHYVAGVINEAGSVGEPDPKQAFVHYRASARNSYVPGAYHYMRMLLQSLPKLQDAQKAVVLQELRMMGNRWKWQMPEIMLLVGDMHAGGWLPDDDGFMAQYHWRMASRMGVAREIADFEGVLKARHRRLTPEMEKRLDAAVEAGMRNAASINHQLEFADLCSE